MQNMQITMISLDLVEYDPNQPRKNKPQSDVNSLANSIALKGLRNPPHYRSDGNGGYIVINGETRTRACKQLGWTEIPCIVMDETDEKEIFIAQVLDNVVRFDMGVMDTIKAYQRSLDLGVPVTDCAKSFGISVSTIEKDLPLINLPKGLQKEVDQKSVSKEVARKLAELHDENFSDAEIMSAWKHSKRAPSAEGQIKRLEVWKTTHQGENTILDDAKEDTDIADRRKYGKAVSQLLTTIGKFSKREDFVSTPEIFMQGAMMHLTKEIKSGQFKVDLNHCYKVLDEIKAGLTTYEAHK